ncbi:TolC family outer membrane protein [Hahella sp. SMD15-11]|uniref:TolC family outer membrane protein n=1 Tax=Thermohahella caldifontis TaxID=3142973 RepID=A0AB39UUU1_9GAMM
MKRSILSLFASSFILVSSHSYGLDLSDAYAKARDFDSELAAATAQRDAQIEGVALSKSALLPSISAGGSYALHDLTRKVSPDDTYTAKGLSLTLSQKLYDKAVREQYAGAQAQAEQAEAALRASRQDLIVRTARAYFDVLRAWEALKSAQSTEKAFEQAYRQARERYDVGLIAITEVHESKAVYDSGVVARINARGQLDVALENLARIIGEYTTEVNALSEDFSAKALLPADVEGWEDKALKTNPQVIAARWAVDAAEKQLAASQAGRLPVVSVEAGYSWSDLDGFYPSDETTRDASLTLKVGVPLYTGGAISAGVRQAQALLRQARFSLDTAQRNTRVQLRRLYSVLTTNVQAIEARHQEIVSNESALKATRAGYDVGTRNIVEVLDAERKYYDSLVNYASARYDFVVNLLTFKQAAGTLSQADVDELNQWLTRPVNTVAAN